MMTLLRTMLVLATLACPLNCMGVLQAAHAPSQTASIEQHHCSCCSHSCQSHQEDSAPASPGDDCKCSNCLCQGAVVEADQLILDQSPGFSDALPVEDLMLVLQAKFNTTDVEQWLRESSRRDSAPPIRILLQSFLL